jgi:DNA-binding protein HU-beta
MTKAEFIDQIHGSLGLNSKKDTAALVQATFDALASGVGKDGGVTYPGFGSFKLKQRAARMGRNPQTGASIKIPASKSVGFKASENLKGKL